MQSVVAKLNYFELEGFCILAQKPKSYTVTTQGQRLSWQLLPIVHCVWP
jgi:hypothetical protein